ncbi:MAG: NrtR DNA-binding winged helix domain-containing protein [Prevotella sp.]|jgi:8-oxo-dGTP diphosphatase
MQQYYSQHSKFYVSVDCIVFGFDGSQLEVLIGKRKMDPGRGEWSLYGGFLGEKESLDDAAHRTLLELTGLDEMYMRQVGAFGEVDRDPGDRVVSIAYCALINVKDYDDSLREKYGLEWVTLDKLPEMYSDHRIMIHNAVMQLRRRIYNRPLSFNLLPEMFTLTQLQHVFEAVLGEPIDKRNFRKRIKQTDFVQQTDIIDHTTSRSGAMLYRFNKEKYQEDQNFKL